MGKLEKTSSINIFNLKQCKCMPRSLRKTKEICVKVESVPRERDAATSSRVMITEREQAIIIKVMKVRRRSIEANCRCPGLRKYSRNADREWCPASGLLKHQT